MPEDKLPIPQFAAKIKAKYPEYKDVNDTLLVEKILAKYPEYNTQVEWPPIKKKETSGIGGIVGTSVPLSEENKISKALSTVGISIDKTKAPSEYIPDFDQKDPIKSLLNPIRNKLSEVRKQPVAESTSQDGVQKSAKSSSVYDLLESKSAVEAEDFLNEQEAKGWIKGKLDPSKLVLKGQIDMTKEPTLDDFTEESIIEASDKSNETDQLAVRKVLKNRGLKEILGSSNTLEQAAIKYAEKKGGLASQQLEKLQGDIPNAMKGNLMMQFLNDPDLAELAKGNNDLTEQINTEVYNFPSKYPNAAAAMLANIISKERESRGENNAILNITSEKKNDEIVNDLYEKGQLPIQYKNMYEDPAMRFWVNKKLKTPGLIENIGGGIEQTVSGVGKTAQNMSMFAKQDDTKRLYNALQKQYEDFAFNPKGIIHQLSTHGGNVVGQVLPTATGGNAILASKLVSNPNVANSIMIGLQSYGYNQEKALVDLPNASKAEQEGYALLNTGIEMATENIVNDTKLARQLVGSASSNVKNVIQKFTAKEISEEAAKNQVKNIFSKIIEKSAKFGKGAAKVSVGEANEELASSVLQNVSKQVFGGEKMSERQIADEGFEIWKTTLLGSLILGGAGGAVEMRKNPTTTELLYDMAGNKDYYEDIIKGQAAIDDNYAKDLPSKLSNLEYASKVREELDGRNDLKDWQKKKLLVNLVNEKQLNDAAASKPNAILSKPEEKQAEILKIENEHILDESIGNTKIVQDYFENELLDSASNIMLRDETGKFVPSKVGEYLKFIAQQANGLDENWQPHKDKTPPMPKVPEEIKDIANKRWEKEIEASNPSIDQDRELEFEPEQTEQSPTTEQQPSTEAQEPVSSGISVIMPEENLPPEVVEPKQADGGEPPVVPPIESKVGGLDVGGITHAANEVRRNDRLLPEYQKSPQTFEEWNNEAERLIKDGYDVEKLMDEIEEGKDPNPVENSIRKIYIATLDAEIAKDPSDALLAKQKRFIEIGDLANSRAGRNLVSLKGEGSPLSTISDFYVAKMEAAGVDKLTETQKKETKDAFDKVQKADAHATAAMDAYREEIEKLKAENEVLRQKKESKKTSKPKTKEDFAEQRKSLREKLKQQVEEFKGEAQKMGIQSDGGAKSTIITFKMAKTIGEIAKSYIDEVGVNLKEVVRKTYEEVKDLILGITEKDIHDVLAGEYVEPRPTRDELSAKMRDLRDEAYYINKLERLLKGEEPKVEKKRVERNRQISELQQKIKEFKKAERESAKHPKEEIPADLKKLEAIKKRNEIETAKIKDRIDRGDFEKKKQVSILEDIELQKRFPKQYKAAVDALVKKDEARHEFDIALFKDQMARRTKTEIASDLLGKTAGTAKAITTGIDDSAVAIQTYMSMLIRPRTGVKAFTEHILQAASQKRFDRWLAILHNSPDFKEMMDMGLDVTEPRSLIAKKKEEIFDKRFHGTVKIKGKEYKIIDAPLKPFERAFTTLGNVTRVVGYRTISAKYKREGYTIEKNPELFKSLAERLNTETGRGRQNEYVEQASKVVTLGIWSPRLMSMKFNILGVSDVASIFVPGTKGYYRQLHPKERAAAIKDVAQFAITVMALSYGFALANGGEIDDDPLSSTFMDVKLPNGKSYNFTGGFSGYIRSICQFFTGKKHKEGKTIKVSPLSTAGRFFRGKVPPLTGAALNLASGKNYMGKPTTAGEELINLAPISMRGIIHQIENDGAKSLFTQGVPTFFGFNVKDETDYQSEQSDSRPKRPIPQRPKPIKQD